MAETSRIFHRITSLWSHHPALPSLPPALSSLRPPGSGNADLSLGLSVALGPGHQAFTLAHSESIHFTTGEAGTIPACGYRSSCKVSQRKVFYSLSPKTKCCLRILKKENSFLSLPCLEEDGRGVGLENYISLK